MIIGFLLQIACLSEANHIGTKTPAKSQKENQKLLFEEGILNNFNEFFYSFVIRLWLICVDL